MKCFREGESKRHAHYPYVEDTPITTTPYEGDMPVTIKGHYSYTKLKVIKKTKKQKTPSPPPPPKK